jgi:hypothetical protein
MEKKFILIDEKTGKQYTRPTEKSAERLQAEKACEGVDLVIYEQINGVLYLY